MRDLPIVAKAIVNIILYIVYVIVFSFVFSGVFAIYMYYFTDSSLNASSPIFVNIQYFIAILVLITSLIFRKYFYIWAPKKDITLQVESNNYTAKKKPVSSKKTIKTKWVNDKIELKEDDEIKIYVEKEIK